MNANSETDKLAEAFVEDLINAKQDMMIEEDGTRGLFSPKRREVSLPQNDAEPDKRTPWMEKNRTQYAYSFEKIPGVPMLKDIPKREEFTADYLVRRGLTFVSQLFSNAQLVKIKGILDPFNSLRNYEELFQVLPKPTTLQTWGSDELFAEQRLSGPNPLKITRVKSWEDMPFFQDRKDEVIFGSKQTYGQVVEMGRMFFADYRDLSFIKGVPEEQKYVPSPVALFYFSTDSEDAVLRQLMGYPDAGLLLPIAIQLKPDIPPFERDKSDPDDWQIAKWCVQVADGNDHELRAHWALTHMVMEPFAVATARQLAENHPVGLLLRPHFRYMVYNNNEAIVKLLSKGGWIEQLMGGKLEESIQIALNAYAKWDLIGSAFPNDIAARGMDDKEKFPHYPFRDDGMMLWAAIKKYVKAYLRIYYTRRQDIENDIELQAWAIELAGNEGAKIKGMPEKIETLDSLVEILTIILFTCGPQHSAVNFSQYDYMSNVLNMPLGAYCPFPFKNKPEDPLKMKMQFLPPSYRAMLQQKVAVLLSSFKYDKLGYYKDKDFDDPKAEETILEFQKDLEGIERRITVLNMERQFPYQFMKPSEILNSISV